MSRFATPLIATALLALTPLHAAEGDITVAEYLKAWDSMDTIAIQKEIEETCEIDYEKHPDAQIVTQEIGETANAYRAQFEADRTAGRTPDSCLPDGEAELDTDVLIPHLRTYANSAQVTLAQAFSDLMKKTYPCG